MKKEVIWPEKITIGARELGIAPECMYSMTFHKDDKDIGKLYWDDGVMKFEGKLEESAKVFFDYLLGMLINPYVRTKLAKTETPMNKG